METTKALPDSTRQVMVACLPVAYRDGSDPMK